MSTRQKLCSILGKKLGDFQDRVDATLLLLSVHVRVWNTHAARHRDKVVTTINYSLASLQVVLYVKARIYIIITVGIR